MDEQERKLIRLALRVAATYCRLAETHTYFLHHANSMRTVEKAKQEVAMVEGRLLRHETLFGTETDAVAAEVLGLKKRIRLLEQPAA